MHLLLLDESKKHNYYGNQGVQHVMRQYIISKVHSRIFILCAGFILLGIVTVFVIQITQVLSLGPAGSPEAESGTVNLPATVRTDTSASGGSAIAFNRQATVTNVKILTFGDSLTEGDAGNNTRNAYRQNMMSQLTGYNITLVGDQYDGTYSHAGVGGSCIGVTPASPPDWGADCWSRNMYPITASMVQQYDPNIIILTGGTNDFCCGTHTSYPNKEQVVFNSYKEWIKAMVTAKPDVYILTIGQTGYQSVLDGLIQDYIETEATAGKRLYYVSYDGVDTVDSIHPSVQGYQTLANRIVPIVRPILDSLTAQ